MFTKHGGAVLPLLAGRAKKKFRPNATRYDANGNPLPDDRQPNELGGE